MNHNASGGSNSHIHTWVAKLITVVLMARVTDTGDELPKFWINIEFGIKSITCYINYTYL